jgi:hypothetical protein
MLLVMVCLCVEYLLVEEDRNEKFVVKLSVYVCMSGECCNGKIEEEKKREKSYLPSVVSVQMD